MAKKDYSNGRNGGGGAVGDSSMQDLVDYQESGRGVVEKITELSNEGDPNSAAPTLPQQDGGE